MSSQQYEPNRKLLESTKNTETFSILSKIIFKLLCVITAVLFRGQFQDLFTYYLTCPLHGDLRMEPFRLQMPKR